MWRKRRLSTQCEPCQLDVIFRLWLSFSIFGRHFYSVSSWSAFLRHLVHQRSLTGLAQAGEGGAGLLRPRSPSPFKGKRRRFNLSCTMFCYIAATIWQLRFLCLVLSDRGRNYQSIASYFRTVWNDVLVTAWWCWHICWRKILGPKWINLLSYNRLQQVQNSFPGFSDAISTFRMISLHIFSIGLNVTKWVSFHIPSFREVKFSYNECTALGCQYNSLSFDDRRLLLYRLEGRRKTSLTSASLPIHVYKLSTSHRRVLRCCSVST